MIRKNIVFAVLVTFCLTAMLFMIVPVGSQGVHSYDPWWDLTDDGKIDIADVARISAAYGTYGTPINKTELLLELQGKIDALNATITEQQNIIDNLKSTVASLNETTVYLNQTVTELSSAQKTGLTVCAYSQKDYILLTGNDWATVPGLNVSITLNRTSFVRVTVSGYMTVGTYGYWFHFRTRIDSNVTHPGEQEYTTYGYQHVVMDFCLENVPLGVHTVEFQLNPLGSSIQVGPGAIIVTAFPTQ